MVPIYTGRTGQVKHFCTSGDIHARPDSVHHAYMPHRRQKRRVHRRTFIREWREFRGLTLERLAARVGEKIGGFTHASLSRMERGIQPYSQPVLEAIAEALGTEPASLLMRNPNDPEGIWTVWDHAKSGERKTIVEIAKTIVKSAG